MIRNLSTRLIFILAIATLAIWVDFSDEIKLLNPFNDLPMFQRDVIPASALTCAAACKSCLKPTCQPMRKSARIIWKPRVRLLKTVPMPSA